MSKINALETIAAVPDTIFRRLADPGGLSRSLHGMTRWERLDGLPPGNGTRYLVLLRIGSVDAGGVVRITEWDRPRRIAWTSERGVKQTGSVRLTPRGDRTDVAVELDFEVPGARPIAWVVERIVRRLIERRLKASLLTLRRELEFENAPAEPEPIAVRPKQNGQPSPARPSDAGSTAARERFTPVDAAWLRMDDSNHPMTITALLTFDEPLSYEDLLELVEQRLLRAPRFTERVVDSRLPGRLPHWEPDPAFDLRTHVHRAGLPPPGDQRALEELVSELMSTPLDRARPLWQLHLVERFGGGSALIARLHHCIGDGVALVGLMLSLTDEGASLSPEPVGVSESGAHGLDRIRHAGEQTVALARNLLLSADPVTPFKGQLGPRKRVTWSKPIALADVKQAGHTFGATVNDVLMASATGALRAYLDAHDAWIEDLEIRALVPVYIRGDSGPGLAGNHFGLVFVELPLWITDPGERLKEIKRRFDVVKQSPDATVALRLLGAMGVAAAEIERIAVDLFTRKATVMMTNVPGPPARIHLASKALRGIMMWAPVSGHLGLGLSLLSYAGDVNLGVAVDARLVADPEAITKSFETELERLIQDARSRDSGRMTGTAARPDGGLRRP